LKRHRAADGQAAWSASRNTRDDPRWRPQPAAARALAAYITRFYSTVRLRLVFGIMRDQSRAEIAAILFPWPGR